jgi:hypothetical protein
VKTGTTETIETTGPTVGVIGRIVPVTMHHCHSWWCCGAMRISSQTGCRCRWVCDDWDSDGLVSDLLEMQTRKRKREKRKRGRHSFS